ncbi:unnamed protein product [Bursaphelenchus okinawaensis]|uniref:Uncharacterized protein n=1 Tax=Bursaphelenchus okinawaensis TaxID=465554 RepID=A0A811KHI8_9BILA|nr:unnamed protein product [Bursaphelenchus okinawaensis]CAG9103292.1 unnamed protein product [Bursaphelenchus okinawaensis]
MDVKQVLKSIQDTNWKSWLSQAISDPKVNECNDPFLPEIAIRAGAKSQECEAGSCLKMSIKEKSGNSFVWRSCLPDSKDSVTTDCTKVTTRTGDLEVCTCLVNYNTC